ncbi:MAG TPA: LapA family protein [Candidatus Deferrimicrobiaceae bacterium]
MRAILILLVVVMGLVAAFAIQNPGIVTVQFFTLSASTSVLVIIVAAFGAGVLVGFLPGIPAAFRRRKRIRELESALAKEQQKQDSLPPTDPT